MESLKADSVWLWLFNSHSNNWQEWVSCQRQMSKIPSIRFVSDGTNGVIEYCSVTNQTLRLLGTTTWTKEVDGKLYTALFHQEIVHRLGMKSSLYVPLELKSATTGSQYKCVASVHYASEGKCNLKPEQTRMMSRITELLLHNGILSQDREVLLGLSQIAAANPVSKAPFEQRASYLAEIGRYLQKQFGMGPLSIFYRDRSARSIACIYSSGLYENDSPLDERVLYRARYDRGEGRTGKAFETGIPQVAVAASREARLDAGQYFEMASNQSDEEYGWAYIPIVVVGKRSPELDEVVGVLRCGWKLDTSSSIAQPFSSVGIDALEIACRQIASVLQAFEMAMAAELTVAYKTPNNNIYRFVNQLEIQGYERRIPDGILYINGMPLVVAEFKSAVKENTTIK